MLDLHGLTMMFKLCWFMLIECHLNLKEASFAAYTWYAISVLCWWIMDGSEVGVDDAAFDAEGHQEWNL